MKRIKLNSAKLQLKKEKVSSLTNEEMSKIQGGGIVTHTTERAQTGDDKCNTQACPRNGGTIYINPNPLKGGY